MTSLTWVGLSQSVEGPNRTKELIFCVGHNCSCLTSFELEHWICPAFELKLKHRLFVGFNLPAFGLELSHQFSCGLLTHLQTLRLFSLNLCGPISYSSLSLYFPYIFTWVYFIYICMCVCVCVCISYWLLWRTLTNTEYLNVNLAKAKINYFWNVHLKNFQLRNGKESKYNCLPECVKYQ